MRGAFQARGIALGLLPSGKKGQPVMIRPISAVVLSAILLAGCGTIRDSRANPFNWFGSSTARPVAGDAANPLIPARRASVFRKDEEAAYAGTLVGEVSELLVERRPGGAVIRASGVADQQGPFEVALVPVAAETGNGVLTYELRALQPPAPRGSDWSRTLTTAVWLTDAELANVAVIHVRGARNIRSVRR